MGQLCCARPTGLEDDNNQEAVKIKIVLVGDTAVGKSTLITQFLHNRFDKVYVNTILDIHRATRTSGGQKYELEIHDTGGEEHNNVKRSVQYEGADLFIICCATYLK